MASMGVTINPLAPKDNFSGNTVWYWENRMSP